MNHPPGGGFPPGYGNPPGAPPGAPPPGYGAPPQGYAQGAPPQGYGQPGAPPPYGQPQGAPPPYGQPHGAPPPYGAPYAPPGAPPPYGSPYAPPMGQQARQQHPRAMTALILGGVAWFFGLWLICSVPAWIIGAGALREIRANPHLYTGESEAKIGMWLGIVHTVLGAVAIVGIIIFAIALAALH